MRQLMKVTSVCLLMCGLFATSSVCLVPGTAHGDILFDFGTAPTGTSYEVDATANPALGGPAGLTGTIYYNAVNGYDENTVADVGSGLVDSENNELTGVSLDLGVGTDSAMNWSTQPNVRCGLLNARSATGVFNNTTFVDFISATNSNVASRTTVGIRLSGLSAGTYDVWVAARQTYANDDSQADDEYDIYVGAGDNSTAPDSLSLASIQQYNRANAQHNTGSWTVGEGFTWVKSQTSLLEGEDLLIFSESTFDNLNGLVNAVQIQLVPEPSTFVLAIFGLVGLGFFTWRRSRR